MAKLGKKMIALCSVAVGVAYVSGYMVTEGQAQPSMQQASAHIAEQAPVKPANLVKSSKAVKNVKNVKTVKNVKAVKPANLVKSSKTVKTVKLTKSSKPASPPKNVQTQISKKSPFKDGIYTGSSANDLGDLSVSVSVQNGKIANVEIINYDMHYSRSYIDPQMVRETIRQQNTNIDGVSGATASSDNFIAAVKMALSKAAV